MNLSENSVSDIVMDTPFLIRKFERIGARLKVLDRPRRTIRATSSILMLDIGSDRRGEYFEITARPDADPMVEVLDVQPSDRHLLLLVRDDGAKNKYLCGHDERHWFVAGIPEVAPVGTVRQAMEALQPVEVRTAVARKGVSGKSRNGRRNAAFLRQGEWFFLPMPTMVIAEALILQNEAIRRGNGGKPHWAEFCYRTGGETVHVCGRYPNGVTESQFRSILLSDAAAKKWNWNTMRRNPGVYVRGRIRHSDHATISLQSWHQVLMNTESESRAMRNVAFLD